MSRVLLMGHGSPCRCAREELLELRDLLASRLPHPVALGVLEFAAPPLLPAVGEAAAGLEAPVLLQPLLLFEGLHGTEDLPALERRLRQDLGLEVRSGRPFGDDPALVGLAVARLLAAGCRPGDVLLFVGRGTRWAAAREHTRAVAAQVAAAAGLPHVVCYAGISAPDLVDGLRAAAALRPARVLALPYLLHTGVLVRRAGEVLALGARHLGVEVRVLDHLGNAPEVVALLSRRVSELAAS